MDRSVMELSGEFLKLHTFFLYFTLIFWIYSL